MPYYAYDDIAQYLRENHCPENTEDRVNTLSFRTTAYFHAKNILELGAGSGLNTLYITSSSRSSRCVSVETDPSKSKEAERLYKGWSRDIILTPEEFPELDFFPDCIFLNLRNYTADSDKLIDYLFSNVNEDSFIFIDGIRTKRKQQMLWKKLIRRDEVIISMDLFHVGILFFDKRFFKRNYKLSF